MSFNSSNESPFVNINRYAYLEIVDFLTDPQPGIQVIAIATLDLLLGVLTVLACVSIYILVNKGLRMWSSRVLIGCTLLMCLSTWVHCVIQVVLAAKKMSALKVAAANMQSTTLPPGANIEKFYTSSANIASTAVLVINIIIGDGIVWWRACVVWPGNILVRVACLVTMLATAAMGFASLVPSFSSETHIEYGLYLQNNFGTAAVFLSLATNVIATSLIAVKTWQHWRLLRTHLGTGRATSQVLKVLVLLVESGLLYSLLLTSITVWQGIATAAQFNDRILDSSSALWALIYVYAGCFEPLIAIYPTSIIVLVSLEHSTLKNGIYGKPPPMRPSMLRPSVSSETTTESTASTAMTLRHVNVDCLRAKTFPGSNVCA